jgi:hypothetical protein
MCGRDGICQLVTSVFFAMVCMALNFSLLVIPWFSLTIRTPAQFFPDFVPSFTTTTTMYLLQFCQEVAGQTLPPKTCFTFASFLRAAGTQQQNLGTQFLLAARGGSAALAFLALSLPFYVLLSISASMAANARRVGGGAPKEPVGQCGEGCFAGRTGNTAFSVVAFLLNLLGTVIGWAALGSYANSLSNVAELSAVPGAVLAVFSLLASITALCCATAPFCCAPYNMPSRTPGAPSMIIVNPASAIGQSVTLPQPTAFAAGGAPPLPPPAQWKAVEDAQGRTCAC